MTQNRIGISFSNQHCFITKTLRMGESTRLENALSFSDHHNPLHALKSNVKAVHALLSQSAQVILALSSQDISLHCATVDTDISDREILCYIQSQSQFWFGYASAELCMDYETQWIENSTRHILVAACLQTTIQQYQRCFSTLSIPLHVIEVDVLALSRLINDTRTPHNATLLFHQEDQVLVVATQCHQPQKCHIVPTTSHIKLHTYLSSRDQTYLISPDTHFKNQLTDMGFAYTEVDITRLFHSAILNQTPLSLSALHPYLISLGACFWRAA